MKKTLSKNLQLSRETLRDLNESRLRDAAGGQITRPPACGSDANTCGLSCLCGTNLR